MQRSFALKWTASPIITIQFNFVKYLIYITLRINGYLYSKTSHYKELLHHLEELNKISS